MKQSNAVIAVVAALVAATSVCAFARGQSGGRGGHAFSRGPSLGNHAGHGSYRGSGPGIQPGHGPSDVRAPGHVVGPRPFVGSARVGVYIGAPLYAPFYYPAPTYYYYSPAPTYIEQAPTPAYWYFCPELNAYYPYVPECPGGWQPVPPQPAGSGPNG
jgi:hypothetical protein